MHKFLRSILGLLSFTLPGLASGATGQAPRLVVGIHIDQLRADYLEWFKDGFSEDGLKKMLQGGIVYQSVSYGIPHPDAASATASLLTGATPSRHGIIGQSWFDRKANTVVSCVYDPDWLGNYTTNTTSPKQLMASTLGDELKIATNQSARVFSIGLSAESSILAGGHEADGVFWMDDATGQWCTSTYYNYMPWWLQQINDQRDPSGVIDQTAWTPLLPLSRYRMLPYQTSPNLFEYWLGKYGKDKFKAYKETPMVNEEVNRVALKTLELERLGTDDIPDYLAVQFKASGHLNEGKALSTVEIQDIYLRLDAEVGKLIDAIDRQVGLENALIYLVGTGAPSNPAVELTGNRSYHGDFHTDRCTSLLNLYLMALYGDQPWVSGWHNKQVYLNRALIDKQGLDLDQVTAKSAAFLGEFSGVQRVISSRILSAGTYDNTLINYRNAVNPAHSGDFILEIQPGWNIRHNGTEKDVQVRYEAYTTSLLFYGASCTPQRFVSPVSVGDIAATLSAVFRIRPPNACEGTRLPGF